MMTGFTAAVSSYNLNLYPLFVMKDKGEYWKYWNQQIFYPVTQNNMCLLKSKALALLKK